LKPRGVVMGNAKIGSILNDVTVEYASGADNEVTQELIDLLKAVVKSDIAPGSKLEKIYISATTNGTHAAGSRHYSSKAVDISRINGKYMTTYPSDASVKSIVDALQDEGDKQAGIRENFGPKFLHKHKSNWTVAAHDDHIHFSVD
jgi:hypothetical protein